jgi:hypothetical protein
MSQSEKWTSLKRRSYIGKMSTKIKHEHIVFEKVPNLKFEEIERSLKNDIECEPSEYRCNAEKFASFGDCKGNHRMIRHIGSTDSL